MLGVGVDVNIKDTIDFVLYLEDSKLMDKYYTWVCDTNIDLKLYKAKSMDHEI